VHCTAEGELPLFAFHFPRLIGADVNRGVDRLGILLALVKPPLPIGSAELRARGSARAGVERRLRDATGFVFAYRAPRTGLPALRCWRWPRGQPVAAGFAVDSFCWPLCRRSRDLRVRAKRTATTRPAARRAAVMWEWKRRIGGKRLRAQVVRCPTLSDARGTARIHCDDGGYVPRRGLRLLRRRADSRERHAQCGHCRRLAATRFVEAGP